MKEKREKAAIFRLSPFLFPLLFLAACAKEVPFAAPALEHVESWEGIDRAGIRADTAMMTSIRSSATDSPNQSIVTGNLEWRLVSIDDMERGVAHTWAGMNDQWIAARLILSYVPHALGDTMAPIDTRIVVLKENLVLIDELGNRSMPLKVHERIYPRIDLPMTVDTGGLSVAVIFPIKRGLKPAAIEIHYPLGSGRIQWFEPSRPSDWIALDQRIVLSDKSLRALWDVNLKRAQFNGAAFTADISFRNVTSAEALVPNPALTRLYTGSGKTIASASLPESIRVAPGKTAHLKLLFADVPWKESLELVLPYDDQTIRIQALPGFLPENPVSMNRPMIAQGIKAAAYMVRRENGYSVRIGLTNNGDEILNGTGMRVTGLYAQNTPGIEGIVRDLPSTLYPGFEERRWIDFPREVSAVAIDIPGKKTIRMKI